MSKRELARLWFLFLFGELPLSAVDRVFGTQFTHRFLMRHDAGYAEMKRRVW